MQTSLRTTAKKFATGLAVAAMSAAPLAAFAQSNALKALENGYKNTGNAAGIATQKTLPALVGSFIQAAIGLLGVILVVLVIYAGFLWMTAQGNEEKVKKAKQIITQAVIGIILIFAAYAITGFVVSALGTATTGT
jgi:amino acid transporter